MHCSCFDLVSLDNKFIYVYIISIFIFLVGAKSGDYHDDMNATNFMNWVNKQLLPNLPPASVLVIDNAAYHNKTVERHPTSGSLKNEMINWLTVRNIPFDSNLTKPELYELIKIHKPRHNSYVLDSLLNKHGHNVLRLPPYHPTLNPIEKIWALVKNWVATMNVTFKLKDVEALAIKKFSEITKEEWAAVCRNADQVADNFMKNAHMLEEAIEKVAFIVNTGESDYSEDDSDEDGVAPLSDSDED